jgi:hypothetical protein
MKELNPQSPMETVVPSDLTLKTSHFVHSVYSHIRDDSYSSLSAIISLYSINQMVFVMAEHCSL